MQRQTLTIDSPEAIDLANALAERTGKSVADVVTDALRHEQERVGPRPVPRREVDMEAIRRAIAHASSLPLLTHKTSQELLDELYDENGLPA